MGSEFEGNINGFYKRVTQDAYKPTKEEVKDWKNEANQKLRETKTGEVVTSYFWRNFFIFFSVLSVVAMLIMSGYFVYYVGDGKFKNTNTQSVSLEQNVTSNVNVNNSFDNTFNNDVKVNATVNMYVDNLNIYTNSS